MGEISNNIKKYRFSMFSGLAISSEILFGYFSSAKTLQLARKKQEDLTAIPDSIFDLIVENWKEYIPAAITFGVSVSAIVAMGLVNRQDVAQILATYLALQTKFKNYRNSANELYGDHADFDIIQNMNVKKKLLNEDETVLFYDSFADRYFEKTYAEVLEAEYLLNKEFSDSGEATLNSFYYNLGLDPIEYGNNIRWSINDPLMNGTNQYNWIDFSLELVEMDDGTLSCYEIMFETPPSV